LSNKTKRVSAPPSLALQAKLRHGLTLHQAGHVAAAEKIYEEILRQAPDYFDALHLQGILAYENRRHERAVQLFSKAIGISPDIAAAYHNRGNALLELERFRDAVASYNKAIALNPDYLEAYNNRGIALNRLDRFVDAIASYDRALRLAPDLAEAHCNRAIALNALHRFKEALQGFERAISLRPDFAEAHYNRGITFSALRRFDEAVASYDTAIAVRPENADAYCNRGMVLGIQKRFDAALESTGRALALKPDLAEAFANRSSILNEMGRYSDALADGKRAVALEPHRYEVDLRYLKRKICDWSDPPLGAPNWAKLVEAAPKPFDPLKLATLAESPALQLENARHNTRSILSARNTLGPIPKRSRRERIRLGYFSANFNDHAVAHLMQEVLRTHDKTRFETFAFACHRKADDAVTQRLRPAFEHYFDIRDLADEDAAALARRNEIDIVVDLTGHTDEARTGVFAHRAAPIQVNYLGFPGTLGLDYIDYILADAFVIPGSQQRFYAENVVYLPDTYLATSHAGLAPADAMPVRRDAGLPDDAIVFCCFNAVQKISPEVFDIWMRILHRVQGSVLWLSEPNAIASDNLRREATRRGIDPARLVFAARSPAVAAHLARCRLADLFLDTLPYNAHTTAADALWAGVPVLTRIGTTFAGRVAASLLTAVGLPELVTESRERYESLAIELATNPEKLGAIKEKLARNRRIAPLFDTPRFTRHLEAAYRTMYERYQADLPPAPFSVA
jgi:predicted O-linked N-acetylglucosamine transferase (SPINDLY family)